MSRMRWGVVLASSLILLGCGPEAPLRIGFIGGLSDRNSDVGQAGHNGVLLAVEQANRAGGIGGHKIELVSRDDAQDAEIAAKSAAELAAEKVEAVIGPFTSGMAAAVVPVLARRNTLAISPTLTSMDFHGKDDNLIRINRSTRDNAEDYARVLFGRGQRRIAVAYDVRNRSFSESWLGEFRKAFAALGGTLAAEVAYESRPDVDFGAVVAAMLKGQPDGLFFISGGIDVARLAQQSRRQAPGLPIGASEWAASEQLIELGGKVVDGLVIVQNYNREDDSPRYREFREAYFKRFQKNPGYSSVSAYDAATVLFDALARRTAGESVKMAVLRHGPYQGLQQQIVFDANGDTQRKVFFTEIRDGRFVLLK
ncbi:ABC transporter substrate-binding protein [Zoogloea sp.]|uniref:ABC transporter substrate-binding protein n=1 Tax=Zoogloea sp. TaxID=49181 RepID=UPI0035B4EA70